MKVCLLNNLMYFFRFFLSFRHMHISFSSSRYCLMVPERIAPPPPLPPQVKGQTVLILILLNSDMSCVINLKYINTHFKGEGNTKNVVTHQMSDENFPVSPSNLN